MNDAYRAQCALAEIAERPCDTAEQRDVLLLRFMLASEATWKAAQMKLHAVHGLDEGSPKGCVRASLQVGWLSAPDADAAMELVDDRNLIVHTYREALAAEIAGRVPKHALILAAWLTAIRRDH